MESKKPIFVFGSNEAGIHGAGAALHARKQRGAKLGVGFGPTGECYAIPTKDRELCVLPLTEIQVYVEKFLDYAYENTEVEFEVTRIGCGLAGYKNEDIAPMFVSAPVNCILPSEWQKCIMMIGNEDPDSEAIVLDEHAKDFMEEKSE